MTQTSGPQRDEPRDPQSAPPMWVAPAKPGAFYPPGFEPGASEEPPAEPAGADPRRGFVEPAEAAAPPRRGLGRRPVVAGVVGGVLIALLGFGGGFAADNLTGGDDDASFATQGISRLAPPVGEGYPGGDEDGDGGPGPRLAPGGALPDAGNHESDSDT